MTYTEQLEKKIFELQSETNFYAEEIRKFEGCELSNMDIRRINAFKALIRKKEAEIIRLLKQI